MIVEHVWDMDYDGLTNIVDVYIRHLRSKIDDRFPQKLIQTVRGIGYMIEAPEKPAERPAGPPRPNRRCDVSRKRDFRRIFRGLRFRLTAQLRAVFHAAADRCRAGLPRAPGERPGRPDPGRAERRVGAP